MRTPISLTRIHDNESGSVILIAVIILVLLTVMGISATSTTDIEFKIVQNTNLYKSNFYLTEGGGIEVAYDVDKAGGGACPAEGETDYRASCVETYAILNINQPRMLTNTDYPPFEGDEFDDGAENRAIDPSDEDDVAVVDNYSDKLWPINYPLTAREYGYRVHYTGQGRMPKGYGVNFGTYVFDISTRKQTTPADGELPDNLTTVINQGFRKIGPKAVL
jgi:hypothetical protein